MKTRLFNRFIFIIFCVSGLTTHAQSLDLSFDILGYKGRLVPGVWNHEWDKTLLDGLVDEGLLNHTEEQIDEMCPGYREYRDLREIFWQQLFISLAWKESLHGPENYVEFNGGVNNGLYQINPELLKAYKCEGLELFDPHHNIQCAARMAKKLVTRFGSFLTGTKGGMAAYWQPLRATSALNRKNREWILENVREACDRRGLEFHSKDMIQFSDTEIPPELNFNGLD